MAIAAHPDDIESWCAGALAQAIDTGATVRLLLVTSGDKGSGDPLAQPAEVARIREQEALAAGRALGLAEVVFLRHTDGEVENTPVLREQVVQWIRRWRPEVVFTHDPEEPLPPYIAHRDHRTVGRVTLDAIYPDARDPLAFPGHRELDLAPHKVGEVWLFASAAAATYVDITEGFDRKIAARLCHASQTLDPAALPASWHARAASIGGPAGLPLAEAFTVLRIDD
jgi:LmbE family N-acetylglucosaminyl deacetylase